MNKDEHRTFNDNNIAEFRSNEGRLSSFGDAPVLLLTTTGAKTGQRRTSPMMYMADDGDADRVYVFASAAGADNNPAWFANIKAHPQDLGVEIGTDSLTADAEVLPDPLRGQIFAEQAHRYPGFGSYQAKTDRPIPVIALTMHR